MRQVVIPRHGPPEVLTLREAPDPTPGEGELRVAVRASGVNLSTSLHTSGCIPTRRSRRSSSAAKVRRRRSGGSGRDDPSRRRSRAGVDAVWRVADRVVVPAAFAFSVAAGLDETVLVHGAGGGVGVGATQLAKLRGATVIGTASAAKHEAIRALGVDHAIDYRTAKVVDEVTRLTNGAAATSSSIRLAAAVLPTAIGCSRRSVARSLRRVANRRRRTAQPVARRDDDRHDAAVQSAGADEPQPWCVREPLADAVLLLLDEIGGGRLRPIVARTFALEHAADAHRFVQSRSNTGKLVLTISR